MAIDTSQPAILILHTLCHICDVQVSVRRKAKPNDTVKQLKKNLEKFAETGVHPEIERLRQERNNAIPALPDLDINRPFVFLDISIGNKPLGGSWGWGQRVVGSGVTVPDGAGECCPRYQG